MNSRLSSSRTKRLSKESLQRREELEDSNGLSKRSRTRRGTDREESDSTLKDCFQNPEPSKEGRLSLDEDRGLLGGKETMRKNLDFTDDLAKKIEEDMKHRGIETFVQHVEEAEKHFLTCRSSEPVAGMKFLILRYATTCLKCGRTLNAGDYALYGRGVGAVCLDCHIERVGDKTTVAKYLRNRELDKVHRGLTNECDALAEKVEVFRTVDKLETLIGQRKQINELIDKYLRSGLSTSEEQEVLLRMKENALNVEKLSEEVRRFIERFLKTAKWKRRQPQTQEEEEEQT